MSDTKKSRREKTTEQGDRYAKKPKSEGMGPAPKAVPQRRSKQGPYDDPNQYPLTPTLRLGDATEEDIRKAARRYGISPSAVEAFISLRKHPKGK